MAPNKLSLRKGEYQDSLDELRMCIADNRSGFFDVQPLLPCGQTEEVHLQLRGKDLYIIGFKGLGGKEYHFIGEKEKGGWGDTDCGVGGNYNDLPQVKKITVSEVKRLKDFAKFEKKQKGAALDGSLIVIAAAVVSEALRFTEVEILFTKLFDEKINSFELQELRDRLFVNWAELSLKPISGLRMKLIK